MFLYWTSVPASATTGFSSKTIKSNFPLKQSIHPSLCVLGVMEALYRLGLLWSQVKLQDDFGGDGVALLRRLEGRKTEGDLDLLIQCPPSTPSE